jgi:hypothetical protein
LIVNEAKIAEKNVYTTNGISHKTQVALNRSRVKEYQFLLLLLELTLSV